MAESFNGRSKELAPLEQESRPDVQVRRLIPTSRQGGPVSREDHRFSSPVRVEAGERQGIFKRLATDLNPRKIGGPKLPLLVLGLSAVFAGWDDTALALLLPEMRSDFGFSLQFLLSLTSFMGVLAIILAPAMGYLADRVKRVWMMRVGAVLSNVAPILQGLAGNVPQLAGARVLLGVGGAVTRPAGFPALSDYYPTRSRTRVFAFLGFAAGLGALAGPIVAGNLAQWFDWRVAVISLGALATVVSIGFFFLKEPVRGYQERIEMGASEQAALREQKPVSWSEAWRAARSIMTVRRLWYATPFLQVAGAGMGIFMGLYFAEQFQLTPDQRGYLAAATTGFGMLGILAAAPLADRLMAYRPGRVMTLMAGLMIMYVVSVLVLVVSRNIWLSIIFSLPLGIGFVAIGPALNTLLSLTIPPRVRGLGMQTIAPWQLIGLALLPFIGRAADQWGLRQGLLVFLPLFVIGALILGSAGGGVARDMRAAKAASMADEEARRAGTGAGGKMLICRDVDVEYEGIRVLFNVDFDVERGEMVALVGTNGAGKSSLLRAIAGIQEASNGAIFLDGQDITHVPAHENASDGVILVPGGRGVFPEMSVRQNLRAAAWLHRKEEAYVREATKRALELFPVLAQRMGQQAGTLSGGEQQMLTLAQALLSRPRLLMIDELSIGLAPGVVDDLLEVLKEINDEGTTVVLVEQSLNVALRAAERLVYMDAGQVRFDGTMDELLARPDVLRSVFMGGASSAGSRLAVGGPGRRAGGKELLKVDDISVAFGGIQALDGVSLEVMDGEIVGLIGPNGAGKSTLFEVVSGFIPQDEGSVIFADQPLEGMRPYVRARMGIGRSFQDARLFPSLTVRENVAAAGRRGADIKNPVLAAVWAPQIRQSEKRLFSRVDYLLELFGLEDFADEPADELSTGTRRAVEIASLTAAGPELVLLDEPSSGLAQAETTELALLLGRVASELRCAMLIIEHDLGLVSSVAHRLIAMHLGKVLADGAPDDVLRNREVVSAYLAASGQGEITSDEDIENYVRQALGARA